MMAEIELRKGRGGDSDVAETAFPDDNADLQIAQRVSTTRIFPISPDLRCA
jgi:hypothetical protein